MLEKILRWIVLIGIFAIPFIALIVDPTMLYPSIISKNFAFRVIVEIIFGSWFALALMYENYGPRRSWILGTFTLFVFVIAIADVQSVNPYLSFWGNYERMDGWVTLIHVLAYLMVASSVIANSRTWRLLFQVSLGVSVFVAVCGFLQLIGIVPIGQHIQSSLAARIDATVGNPIYLAVYMLFHIFIAVLLWYQMWITSSQSKRRIASLVYGAAIFLDSFALFFTGTRGAIIGLIGGSIVTLVILTIAQRFYRLRLVALGSIIAIALLAGCLSWAKDVPFVKEVGFLQRLSTISLSDTTIKTRLLSLGVAWQGVQERPILGWGQENYQIVSQKYYDPRLYGTGEWTDRVHNIIFDWLIAGGIIGLIAYLSIFGATLWTLWVRDIFSPTEKSILTGLLVGYTIHTCTAFDTITSYILFTTVLAYIIFREEEKLKNDPLLPQPTLAIASPFVISIAALIVCGTVWWTNVPAYIASHKLGQALMANDPSDILAYFNQSIAYGTFGTQEARSKLALFANYIEGMDNVPIEVKRQFFDTANSELQMAALAAPLDARLPVLRGGLFFTYGNYKDAAMAFERAHELAPRKQIILFNMALNAHAQGNFSQELKYYKEAYDLDPNINVAAQFYTAAFRDMSNVFAN